MARTKFECYLIFFMSLILYIDTRSLPISEYSVKVTENQYSNEGVSQLGEQKTIYQKKVNNVEESNVINKEQSIIKATLESNIRNSNVRPGQTVRSYAVSITRNGNNFNGIATIDLDLTEQTRDNAIRFNILDMNVQSVKVGVLTDANAINTNFNINNNNLVIQPSQSGTRFVVIIEYTGQLRRDGNGLYLGQYDNSDYVAMNLHPMNARRVFPCMDEPSLRSRITFTFNNMEYETMVSNSLLQAESQTAFRALETPSHVWGMVAHNLVSISVPVGNVIIYGRQGIGNQDAQAAAAINYYFNAFYEWTQTSYFQIVNEQDNRLHIMAVPDINREWYALSTICIWEPYIFMTTNHAVKQRKIALVTIAEAMSRHWFGYVVYPENWRHQWVVTGLGSYVAYDIVREFQTSSDPEENANMLDVNTIFTTDIIQESLLQDAYSIYDPLLVGNNIFQNNAVRFHLNSLLKYKAPAIIRMLSGVLGGDTDLVKNITRALIPANHLEAVSTQSLFNAVNSVFSGNNILNNAQEFITNWIDKTGYPVIRVVHRPGGVQVTQEHFSFTTSSRPSNFRIPLTYTTRNEPNFNNLFPSEIMDLVSVVTTNLGEDDWIIFNIQGQGYYRVNYDDVLWQRIINALQDEEQREKIHPLNRASILDDALNLARAGKLDYSIAFEIVLTMELETDYGVWKTFVRNMDFIRKRLMTFANDNDRDSQAYAKLLEKLIVSVEEKLGFEPQNSDTAMVSLTRALVMEHACVSGYEPCIAAAVDMFYDPNNDGEVNPEIPLEIRPVVYCTMAREGDEEVRAALRRRLEQETSRYERLVILESFACSEDAAFIDGLLADTIAANSPYVIEERFKIFVAVASSSFRNTNRALNFLRQRTNEIRNMYGGGEKLDQVILIMAENAVNQQIGEDFTTWVNSQPVINNLEDSSMVAVKARSLIAENVSWKNAHLSNVYDWVEQNNGNTFLVSFALLGLSLIVTIFNN
ncbi:aminopeptidase N like protein [Danaus plexippus plexippus]|uniref:Aminopeptidase N like protein n=1 Tax=Danaus plexippus plexippus TaxID=278856 RepID=A0A212EJS2_DANPL|nr:aminopeptidase N like protein [Danaus plexippus plexippus]